MAHQKFELFETRLEKPDEATIDQEMKAIESRANKWIHENRGKIEIVKRIQTKIYLAKSGRVILNISLFYK